MWKTGFHEGQNQSAPGIQTQQGGKKSFPQLGVFFPPPLKWAVLHQSIGQCLQKGSRAGEVFAPELFQQGRQKAEVSFLRFLRRFRSFPECLRNHPGAEFIPDGLHRREGWCCFMPLPPFPGRRKLGNIGCRVFHRRSPFRKYAQKAQITILPRSPDYHQYAGPGQDLHRFAPESPNRSGHHLPVSPAEPEDTSGQGRGKRVCPKRAGRCGIGRRLPPRLAER